VLIVKFGRPMRGVLWRRIVKASLLTLKRKENLWLIVKELIDDREKFHARLLSIDIGGFGTRAYSEGHGSLYAG